MDTSQILTREDRITTARESCMGQLGRKYKNGAAEKEKQEKKYRNTTAESELHKRSFLYSFGLRLVLGVVCSLIIFWVRENQISYQGIDYDIIREHILENQMTKQAEEYVQMHMGDVSQWMTAYYTRERN